VIVAISAAWTSEMGRTASKRPADIGAAPNAVAASLVTMAAVRKPSFGRSQRA
jgi:hypothetical protein